MVIQIGALAPGFSLESVQGAQLNITDYRDKSHVLLWFSRGFTCPFCRAYMAQLRGAANEFRALHTEVLQLSPNILSQARIYFRTSQLTFPYLCDQNKRVYTQYGITDGGPVAGLKNAVTSLSYSARTGQSAESRHALSLEILNRSFASRLQHHALTAVEQALVLIDRSGMVRWTKTLGPLENLPDNKAILEAITRAATTTSARVDSLVMGVDAHATLSRSA